MDNEYSLRHCGQRCRLKLAECVLGWSDSSLLVFLSLSIRNMCSSLFVYSLFTPFMHLIFYIIATLRNLAVVQTEGRAHQGTVEVLDEL
jgi:hypothetical protein